jgi:hypothetical protein
VAVNSPLEKAKEGAVKTPRSIELHIHQLLLEGFEDADQIAIRRAVETELTLLLSQGGMPQFPSDRQSTNCINGDMFHLGTTTNARRLGSHIARAIYSGLNK